MINKWMYSTCEDSCVGVLVDSMEKVEILYDVFNDSRKGKVTEITFNSAKKIVEEAKQKIQDAKDLKNKKGKAVVGKKETKKVVKKVAK